MEHPSSYQDPSVQEYLQRIDFNSTSIPKHILGFSSNFELTKQRIEKHFWDLHLGNEDEEEWDSLSALQQQNCEYNAAI